MTRKKWRSVIRYLIVADCAVLTGSWVTANPDAQLATGGIAIILIGADRMLDVPHRKKDP